MRVDIAGVGQQQRLIICVDIGLIKARHAAKPKAQHRTPAFKRSAFVVRSKQITQAQITKATVRGPKQITAGVGQCAIKIKHDCWHHRPLSFEMRFSFL